MKTTRITLTALALLAILGRPALCQQVWQEQRITSEFRQWRGGISIWNDTIYYGEMGWDGISDVYVWTQAQGSRRLIGGDGISRAPVGVWEDRVVVSRLQNGQHKLYLYDSGGVERPIAISAGTKENASISDQLVVWEDHRSGKAQIYAWDPVNGERQISPTSASQTNPRVWGDTVVWEDDRNSTYYNPRQDVYMWNPRDGETKLSNYICSMRSPAIYGDRVTMWVSTSNTFEEDRGLWEWTPQHGLRQLAQRDYDHPYDVMYAKMWGDVVVWQAGLQPSNIGAWDPVHGFVRVNQSALSYASSPYIYGNKVAWVGNNNIYLSTLVPEPSGLVALGGLMIPACFALVRKRRSVRR